MKKIYKYTLIAFLFIVIFSATGCATLSKESTVKKEIESLYPNSTLKSTKQSKDDGCDIKTYYFTNGKFDFEFVEYLYGASGGFTQKSSYSNYYYYLYNYLEDEFYDLQKESNVPFYVSEEKGYVYGDTKEIESFKATNNTYCILRIGDDIGDFGNFKFEIGISRYSDISDCIDLIEEIYDLVEEYIPDKEHDLFTETIKFQFITSEKYVYNEKDKNDIYSTELVCARDTLDMSSIKTWVKFLYKDLVKQELIDDSSVNVEKTNYAKLDNLVINGKQFYSSKYQASIKFIYNPEDGQYYAPVCFGYEMSYNGGVKDYFQREIIQMLYSNCNYTIDDKSHTTTYKIGNDEYKIKWTMSLLETAKDDDYMIFYKNGKDMNIKNIYKLGLSYPGAAYNRFIPLDDFADIMGLYVDDIDQDTKTVYLKSK